MTVFELEEKIKQASQAYYEGNPIMSDSDFDGLIEYLRSANPNSYILTSVGWGYDPNKSIGEKESHMYGDVKGIDRKPRKIEDVPVEFFNEKILKSAKLDGGSMICYFSKGKLVKALTRGKGNIGINKTDKVKVVLEKELNLPNEFDFTGAIRGEFCISNKNWEEMIKNNIVLPDANQRNVAVGYLNRDELSPELKYCDIVFYKVIGYVDDGSKFNSIYINNVINENNFDVKFLRKFIKPEYIVDYEVVENGSTINQNDLEEAFNIFKNKYLCDGVVLTRGNRTPIKLDNKFINKYAIENDEIAYKFEDEKVIAEISNIRWKMSKGNKAIPVINIKPMQLSGVTVQNASAFNAKYVYDNDLGVGSLVELIRSGEVIPYITNVVSGSNGEGRKLLDEMTCPYCGTKFVWDGVDLICPNEDCKNRDFQNLKVWVNNVAQVDGMSETLNFKFFNELNIDSLEKLYTQSYDALCYFGEAENTHKGKFNLVLNKLFNDSIPFVNVLVGLNIKMLGVKNATKLANNDDFINSFKKFINTDDVEDFVNTSTQIVRQAVGQAMSENVCSPDGINKLKTAKYVKDRIDYTHEEIKELIPVVITGKLSIPRKQFESYLNDNGYEVKSAITKDIKYLITDNPDGTSTKNKKANELGIEKITEETIRTIINNK